MAFRSRGRSLHKILALAAAVTATASVAQAATFRFDTDPFAGTTALETPGRQVVGGELFIPEFDLESDLIEVASGVFDIEAEIIAFNGLAATLPDERFNFIALRDIDADNNPVNGFNLAAPLAANLIADRLTQSGAGFFIYFNTTLNAARLVYSTDLSSRDADLKIIARFQNQSGQFGIDNLDEWGPQISAVPEPSAWALMILGFGAAGATLRRARRAALV